jgi:hypothetical protein
VRHPSTEVSQGTEAVSTATATVSPASKGGGGPGSI